MKMNIKCIYLSLIMLFLIPDLFAQESKYSIIGFTSLIDDGEEIMLFNLIGDEICSVDTAIVREGKFGFEGVENKQDFSILTSGNYPNEVKSLEVILEQGDIFVRIDSLATVEGTYLNDLYAYYNNERAKYEDSKICKIENQSALNNPDSSYYDFCVKFAKKNISNAVGIRVFLDNLSLFTKADFYNILRYNTILSEHKSVVEYLNRDDERDLIIEKRKALIGNVFTDFELLNSSNMVEKISDYVGKSDYLLIDFWASWCAPCVAEIPKVKELYEKYDKNKLNILSISLDFKRDSWLSALKRFDMPWVHLLITGKEDAELRKKYHLVEIPYYILINREGIIVDVFMFGDTLDRVEM